MIDGFVKETCVNCSIEFYMTEQLYKQRLEDGKSFFCPAGHSQYYTNSCKSKLEKAQKDIESLRRQLEDKEKYNKVLRKSIVAYRAWVTRLRRQVLLPTKMEDVERCAIRLALAAANNNRQKAAEILDIGERTLYRKIKLYGLGKNGE